MEIECIGKISKNGQILIDSSLIEKIRIGTKIRIKIMVPEKEMDTAKKELSPAAKRLLKRMKNAKPIGASEDPKELSHSRLMEERIEDKFPSGGGYESDISEAMMMAAEQDWKDWVDSEEDIYEDYRQYLEKG
jgi:hypothetical protein